MKTTSKLAIRILPDNPNHHLWNNNGTWWCHLTQHLADFTKQRIRLSLKTTDLTLAKRRRDQLLSNAVNNHRYARPDILPWLLLLLGGFLGLSLASAQPTAGQFQSPFKPIESYHRDQWHFEFNGIGNSKYHAGEDWNRGAGQDDYGDAIYASADGVVAYVDKQGTTVPSIGKVVVIRYTLPDGGQIDDLRIHCADVVVSKYDQNGNLTKVTRGQKVATIGGNPSHLHWELHKDLGFWWYTNPYYSTITPGAFLRYLSPSLFVDDRTREQLFNLRTGWNYLQVAENTASSSAFIENGQTRLSLKRARDAGWIDGRVHVKVNGIWYYYSDPDEVFFEPGLQYAVYGRNTSTLHVFYSGHKFKADRARRDIVQTAFDDDRYRTAEVKSETYGENLAWSGDWELRYLALRANGKATAFYQACNRHNPLIRAVGFTDPDTGTFSGWREIPKNRLQ